MKDITRIHIAKVPYNIELSAKKELETYIAALEAYTSDEELLNDIEIRITELLLERGVKQENVVTSADVKAIRALLGEPKDFMADEATVEVDAELLSGLSGRKLYRNLDTAVLGGVLGGIASYFKINALWVRLAFIVLIFISFGTFALLYVVLWLIIPAARTAAEKLQLAGRPVTLASIRELNESGVGVDIERRSNIQKRVASMLLGIFGIVGALVTAGALIFALVVHPLSAMGQQLSKVYQISFLLAAVAGVLLFVLFLLVAFAAFAQKFNKRIWISGIIIIVLGLGSFGTAIAIVSYQQQLQYEEIQRNTIDTIITLPEAYSTIKSLTVDVPDNANVVYVADNSTTSIKQRALKSTPKVQVSNDNGTLNVKLAKSDQMNRMAENTITLYGPHLDGIIVSNGHISYSAANQMSLKVEVYNTASLRLTGSRIETLIVKTDGNAQFSADEAAVAAVKASLNGQSSVSLGNIKSLDVSNPDVCGSNETSQLSVQNILSATYIHNGIEASVKSTNGPCLNVEFLVDTAVSSGYKN
jgi:phage shock protein PspC (stress-responsive transcriptional regulator)